MKHKMLFILVGFLTLSLLGLGLYTYLYKERRDIATESPEHFTEVNVLKKDFEINEAQANAKYLDKTIAVKGTVTAVDDKTNTITLDNSVFCITENKISLKIGQLVVIKGRLIGFDSLLSEVKLDQCTLVND